MWRAAMLVVGVFASSALLAHETGDPAHHAKSGATSNDRPHLLADGRLHVPKPVQHLLGLRTEVHADGVTERIERLAEVVTHPQSRGAMAAPQAGRIETSAGAWPLAGQAVKAGEVLAVLHPLMSERERAQRRAAMAGVQQKLDVARINAGRMRLQADAAGDAPVRDNIYLEQAEAELATQERQLALASETLQGALRLRASADGVLNAVHAKPGDVVATGSPLFELATRTHTRVALVVFDPRLAERIREARLRLPYGQVLPLKFAAQASDPARPGWRLLFDASESVATPLFGGQFMPVELELAPSPTAQRCAEPAARVWVHVAPEIFEPRPLKNCSEPLRAGDRRVVQGAALLDEYL